MQRQTAFKVWISDLVGKEFIIDESEQNFSYVLINDNKVSRVNIMATVIEKYNNEDNTYAVVVLDDSSGTIRIKFWREDTALITSVNVGDIINVIGRVRNYQDEIYVTPTIVKKLDSTWFTVRKAELIKLYGKPKKAESRNATENVVEEKVVDEKISDNTSRQRLLSLISKYEEGIDVKTLVKEHEIENVDYLIEELIKDGEVFEFKGKLKAVN